MLVRRRETLSLALVCFFVVSAGTAGATDSATKLDRAKQADRSGYAPVMLSRAAVLGEVEPNDSVDAAQTIGVADQVDASIPSGDVDWFLVDATGTTYVTVSTVSRGGSVSDTVLDVFAADGATLLASDDDGGLGLFSAVQSLPGNATLAVRVTRFSSLGDDDYSLVVEAADAPPAPPANDAPATAEVLNGCNGVVQSTTVGASNAFGASDCVSPDPLGGDVFYRVEVPYSYQLVVQVEPAADFDPAVVLFTDPSDATGSCIAGVDVGYTGEVESLIFTNEDPSEETAVVYVGVDGWDPQRTGDFVALISCDFVVENENVSFGAMKARF